MVGITLSWFILYSKVLLTGPVEKEEEGGGVGQDSERDLGGAGWVEMPKF